MQLQGAASDPNTLAHLAGAVQAQTYAMLAVRDKLDELVQVLREKRDS